LLIQQPDHTFVDRAREMLCDLSEEGRAQSSMGITIEDFDRLTTGFALSHISKDEFASELKGFAILGADRTPLAVGGALAAPGIDHEPLDRRAPGALDRAGLAAVHAHDRAPVGRTGHAHLCSRREDHASTRATHPGSSSRSPGSMV